MADPSWKSQDWQYGAHPFGVVMDRIVSVLGEVPEPARARISKAMLDAKFDVTLRVPQRHKPIEGQIGATIAMNLPTKGPMPLGLMPILMVLGWPHVGPSSITPLLWDRLRAFWEYGKAPVRGELAMLAMEAAEQVPPASEGWRVA